MFVAFSTHNIDVIKLMFVSLLCMTLLDLLTAKMWNVYQKKKKLTIIIIIINKKCQSTVTSLLYFCVTPLVCSQ